VLDAVADAYLDEDKPDDNKGNSNDMDVRTEAGKQRRSLIRFDVSTLPSGTTGMTAILSLYVDNEKNLPLKVSAHALGESWRESETTWRDRDAAAGLAWSTPGGTYLPTALSTTEITQKDIRFEWDVSLAVQDWVNNVTPNNGLLLIAPVGGDSEVEFSTRDDSHADEHPRLKICY
jgi:hypothetical protein